MYATWLRRITPVIALGLILGASELLSAPPVRAQHTAQQVSRLVAIQNFKFNPATVTIPAGMSVTWINLDVAPHTSTSTDSPPVWNSGRLNTGQQFTFTFNQPGTYNYFCAIHPHMRAQIIVQSTASSAPAAAATGIPLAAYPLPAKRPAHRAQKKILTAEVNDRYVFSPVKASIKVGTKVTWINKTDAPHTVTSKSSAWTFDKKLDENAQLSFVFRKAGTYHYLCKYHPGMVGTIVVKG